MFCGRGRRFVFVVDGALVLAWRSADFIPQESYSSKGCPGINNDSRLGILNVSAEDRTGGEFAWMSLDVSAEDPGDAGYKLSWTSLPRHNRMRNSQFRNQTLWFSCRPKCQRQMSWTSQRREKWAWHLVIPRVHDIFLAAKYKQTMVLDVSAEARVGAEFGGSTTTQSLRPPPPNNIQMMATRSAVPTGHQCPVRGP